MGVLELFITTRVFRKCKDLGKRVDSLLIFPQKCSTDQYGDFLNYCVRMGTGEPSPYGRPSGWNGDSFIKITVSFF